MSFLPIVVLSAFCLLNAASTENGANCLYKRKTYNDGDTVIDNCLICECINGEIKDCSTSVNCTDKKSPHVKENDITYKDEEVIESSNRKAVDIVKHSLNMRDNLIKVPEGQSNVIKVQINSSFQAGGIVSAQGGVNVDGADAKTIVTEVGNSHEEKQGTASTFGHEGGNKEKDWKVDIKIKENTSKGNKEPTPLEGKSCMFNKESVSDGQTIELESVTCICNDGALTCVKNEGTPGICSVSGYQMIRTFDGTLYETPGKCSYILAKTPAFTMTLNNKLCNELGKVDQDPEAVCIDSVDIYIPSKASIKLLSDGTILSAGENTSLPYSILETITVLRSSSTFLDVVSPLFNLQYDSVGNRLYVILDPSYKGQTSGLCGTYNDNRNDDYRSSSDITETVSSLFSKSWRVTSHSCSEQEKGSENGDKKVEAVLICADALESSIFDDCARLIDTHSFKTSCANTVYYDNTFGLCSALADYAYRCARHGIIVPVSSSFVDCTPVCDGEMILNTESVFSQQDCAEYSTTLLKISPSIPLNEACICPPDLYYDASENKCVPGDSCPCYSINRVFKLGETVTQANGDTCPCERVLLCGGTETPPEVVQCSENEVNADCLVGYGKTCEPSCQNLQVLDQNCALDCQPGCVCKFGLLRSNNGSCIPISECPCLHGDDVYNPGETLAQDCNTCTCEHGKFVCTNKQCNRVCNAYGESQFFLFDNIWKSFSTRQCPIVLAQSRRGESPSFNVVMQNLPNEVMGGALQKKIIKIHFGGASVVLSEFDPTVVQESGSMTQVRIYRSGFYVVAHFLEGLAVYYDQHLDVIIQLEPQLQGKVEGMCGDGDGTTSGELTISNMAQYASQYLVGECPDQETTPAPPTENQKKFVETQCNLLKSDEFAECHTVVNVESYYTACVEETEGCGEGEGFPCFCTSLAAYARACCRKGVTIEWRSPDICPSPCEYYNRDAGEGPYHLVMRNGKTLVADYDTKAVVVEFIEPGNLKASFMVTPSLYVDPLNGRKLVSLESAEHHNFFIVQNDDGSLSLKKWQPSMSFRISATFIQRPSRLVKEYDTLESYSARGNFLSFRSDRLFMSRVMSGNIVQMNFKLTEESFGLPSFSICTWKYRACGSPCIKTCQDPLGTKCTLTLKVEGCYPICAPGKVFDEITHRCVQYGDCVTPPAETSTSPKTTPVVIPTTSPSEEPCKDRICTVEPCKDGEYLQQIDSTDPCCLKYECIVLTTPRAPTTMPPTTPEKCRNVDCNVDFCKDGEYLQQVPSTDPCCLHYVCIGTTTPIPMITTTETCKGVTCNIEPCADGEYLQQVATTDPCCPHYECVESPKTTTPSTTSYEPCKNVLCEPPVRCTKNGAKLVEVPWPDTCCPHYECQCQVACDPPPTCVDGSPPVRLDDPDVECCPAYECRLETTTGPSVTSPQDECKNVVCPIPDCQGNVVLVEVPSDDPCCKQYNCVPFEPTPTPRKPCQGVTCAESACLPGQTVIVKENPLDPCCPLYDCVESDKSTTPPPKQTTPHGCKHIVCKEFECNMKGSVKVEVEGNDPCCPTYDCVCEPCSPPPYCNGQKPTMEIDPETQCCPTYTCPPEITPSKPTFLTTLPPPLEPCCKNVLCEPMTCDKKGATPKIIPWADKCCPHFICECQNPCPPIPTCDECRPPLQISNPKTDCCPTYECQIVTTTPKQPDSPTPDKCQHVECKEKKCLEGETLVQVEGNDPCCPLYDCVSTPVTTAPPTTPKPCSHVTCIKPECKKQENLLVKSNSEDPCCPLYECVPIVTPSPNPETTKPNSHCTDVECPVVNCTKEGSTRVFIGGEDPCCPAFTCECQLCLPPPDCGEHFPSVEFNPSIQCCPQYSCPPVIPTATVPVPLTTAPSPPEPCKNVLCAPPAKCIKNGAELVEVPWPDICCPHYECQCQVPCDPPPTCVDGSPPVRIGDPDVDCCPHYACRFETTTVPSVTTPQDDCKNILCPNPVCEESYALVEVPTDDQCCKAYICVPVKPTPTPSKPCQGITCTKADCLPGQIVLVKENPMDPCCPWYDCEEPDKPTTPPPKQTTPNGCLNIVCKEFECNMEGSVKVEVEGEDPCCPTYDCVCEPCTPVPYCNGQKPTMKIDPETQCCPTYTCPPETIPSRTPAISTTPPPPEPCKDVFCEPVTCDRKGATPKIIPWADKCCPRFVCECRELCSPPPTCVSGRPPYQIEGSDTNCCPQYQCEVLTTPETHQRCEGITCSPPICPDLYTLVEIPGADLCCPGYECVPPPTTSRCEGITCSPPVCPDLYTLVEIPGVEWCCPVYECVPPPTTIAPPISTSEPCELSVCPPPNCGENEIVIVKSDPEDMCCPIYACEQKKIPTTPRPETTTTYNVCKEVVCTVVECTKEGSKLVFVGWDNACCSQYECQCEKCSPISYCDGRTPLVSFDSDSQCCPTYECLPEETTPKPEPTTVIIRTTQAPCKNVICQDKVCKDNEKLVISPNPLDPCCPLQRCVCSCKTVPACSSDERLVTLYQNNQCCPRLICEKKRDQCHTVHTEVKLTSGQCSATVILSSCKGYCHSKTGYSSLWTPVSHCRCCSVTATQPKNFELPCPDGTKARLTVQEASQCSCKSCTKDYGSGSGSGDGQEGSGYFLWSNFGDQN